MKIDLIDLDGIGPNSWEKAVTLVKGIDEFDAPFVALAIEMNCFLWTGDKKLKGLANRGINWVVETNQLFQKKRFNLKMVVKNKFLLTPIRKRNSRMQGWNFMHPTYKIFTLKSLSKSPIFGSLKFLHR